MGVPRIGVIAVTFLGIACFFLGVTVLRKYSVPLGALILLLVLAAVVASRQAIQKRDVPLQAVSASIVDSAVRMVTRHPLRVLAFFLLLALVNVLVFLRAGSL